MAESVSELVDRAYWQVLERRGDAGPGLVGVRAWLVEALTEFEVRLAVAAACDVPEWHPEADEEGL
jgi:hypothetical protein